MKYFKIPLALIASVALLTACDKEENVDKSKSEKLSGVVTSKYIETYTVNYTEDDLEYNVSVPIRNKANNEDNILVGDKITVYYDGKFKKTNENSGVVSGQVSSVVDYEVDSSVKKIPTDSKKEPVNSKEKETEENKEVSKETSKKETKTSNSENPSSENFSNETELNETESNEGTGSEENSEDNSKDKTYFESLPELETSGAESRKLRTNEYALIYDLIDGVEKWDSGLENEDDYDYEIKSPGGTIATYNSKTRILNNLDKDSHVKLHKPLADVLMSALKGTL